MAKSIELEDITESCKRLSSYSNDTDSTGPAIAGKTIWLQSSWGFDGVNQYFYSTDGKNFTPIGTKTQLVWGSYRGDRLGIFNYNLTTDAGLIDVDAFTYRYASEASKK